MEGIVQDLIGPTTLLDQVIGGKPVFLSKENEFEPDDKVVQNKEQPKE